MEQPSARDELLTVEEVAARLRVPAGTLRQWRHNGVGPESFKIGRRVVYYASVVEAYVAERARATSSHH